MGEILYERKTQKMKRTLRVLTVMLLCIIALCGCRKDDINVPTGMQLVNENKSDGYVFFGPEGWVVANHGNITSAYLSTLSRVSVTFTKFQLGDGENIADYFTESLDRFDFPVTFYRDDAPVTDGAATGIKTNFGTAENGADDAYKYIYTYKYEEIDYTCLQILLKRGESHYIFTYTASGLPTDETGLYKQYLSKIQVSIDSFYFTAGGNDGAAPEYERDSDGYILVSDSQLSGFELYVPDDYTVLNNSGLVELKINENAAISVTRASETGKSVLDYLQKRRAEILTVADSFEDIRISIAKPISADSQYLDKWNLEIMPEYDEALKFGDLDKSRIAAYEYAYTYNGKTYRVYQILGTDRFYGYVFTYTATADEFDGNFSEVKTILEKVSFK